MGKKIGNKIRPKKVKNNGQYNIRKIKKLLKAELYSKFTYKNQNENENLKSPSFLQTEEKEENDYYLKYAKYMEEDFNSNIVSMLIVYLNRNKDLLIEYQKEPNFINNFINVIKHLLMNEFELSCFTIILDEMGWSHPQMDHWIYLYVLGVYSKKIVGGEDESSLLIDIFSQKNYDFITYYTMIDDEMMNKFDEKNQLTVKSINERFRQLTKPINSYCRRNFINYNGVVDKIVKWSQPYGDESNGNQLYNNEQQTKAINAKNELELNLIGDYKQSSFLLPLNAQNSNNNLHINNNINNNSNININNNNNNSIIMNNISNNNFNSFLMPYNSNTFFLNDQTKNYMNNQNINKYNISELNMQNSYMPSLNLVNRSSSQFSLKLENNQSNQNLNNLNNLI